MPIESHGEKTVIIYPDEGVLEVSVPIRWVRTKGQRRILSPSNHSNVIVDENLRDNLIKAHHWECELFQRGITIERLALGEGVDKSDMSRILRLTTLAPDIQEDLLLRKGQWVLSWAMVRGKFPSEWDAQREMFAKSS